MSNFASNRIILPLVTVGGLLLALMMGKWVAGGSLMMPGLVIGGIFGAIFFLTLGRMYWYMIPFALASGLPAIPLGGRTIELGELAVAACTAIFVARVAMKKDRLVLFRATHFPLLFCFGYICFVWFLNPTGLLFLGSETMGGRYYLKIVLGFCAFLVMASQEPTEKDFLRIIYLVFAGIMLKTLYGIAAHFLFGGGPDINAQTGMVSEEGYTWQQVIAGPATIITYYLFSRYRPSEIFGFQRPWAMVLYGTAIIVAALSGKRMGLFLTLSTPFLSALVYREYRHILIASALGALGLVSISMGQGNVFVLPFTAQRALSWLPADWDPSLKQLGSGDIFRKELREIAMDDIRENPIFGKGYATSVSDVITGYNMMEHGSGLELERVMGHAMSKNWHNMWLGYAADFGIPYMVMYVVLYIMAFTLSLKLARGLPHPSTRQIFCLYAFFSVCAKIFTINSSGHSALDAFETWWLYGLLFAVAAQVKLEKREQRNFDSITTLPDKAKPVSANNMNPHA